VSGGEDNPDRLVVADPGSAASRADPTRNAELVSGGVVAGGAVTARWRAHQAGVGEFFRVAQPVRGPSLAGPLVGEFAGLGHELVEAGVIELLVCDQRAEDDDLGADHGFVVQVTDRPVA